MSNVGHVSEIIRKLKLAPDIVTSEKNISLRTLSPHSNIDLFSRDVADITVWRNMFPDAYMTVFFATWERTSLWLSEIYDTDNEDIMLMATDSRGVSFGHFSFISFTNDNAILTCELSRVVRGSGLGPRNGMNQCILMGLSWCAQELGVRRFNLRVFSDNERAIHLYTELGFRETEKVSLKKKLNDDGYKWEYTDSSHEERSETLMTLNINED